MTFLEFFLILESRWMIIVEKGWQNAMNLLIDTNVILNNAQKTVY